MIGREGIFVFMGLVYVLGKRIFVYFKMKGILGCFVVIRILEKIR